MPGRGRHRRERVTRLSRTTRLLTAGGIGLTLPLLAAGGASALQPGSASSQADGGYTVAAGDTLAEIARGFDIAGGWEALYEENRQVIGENPDLIRPGVELAVDADAEASDADLVAQSAPAQDAAAAFSAPVDAAPSTAYGVAGALWSSGYHTGVDFAVGTGTSVVSVAPGEVVSAAYSGSYGNEVVIRHEDGHYSQYAHLSSLSVSAGQAVGAGEEIGLSGSTGNSTGPHLHFEVRTGPGYGSDIDPLAYLRDNGVTI